MRPIHDTDILLMLATALAAKRRPARLVEILAAMDVLNDTMPPAPKLSKSFARLGSQGLMLAVDDGFTLTAEAQAMVATQPKRGDLAEQIFSMKQALKAYTPNSDEHASVSVGIDHIEVALQAHRSSAQGAGKNLLMPIRSKETENKRAGGSRRAGPRKSASRSKTPRQ